MSVAARLAIVALRPIAQGACREARVEPGDAAVAPVGDLLLQRLTEHHASLVPALKIAMERSWKAIEIALNGAAWWRGLTSPDDRLLAEQLKPFFKYTEPQAARLETIRRLALSELKDARKKGVLALGAAPAEGLARMSAMYAKFADPAILAKADESALKQMSDELKQAGFDNLAQWIAPGEGESLLTESCRFFLERAVKDDATLAQGLTFADFEPLPADLAQALAGLQAAIASQSRRIEELLGNAAAAAPETRIAALDPRIEQPKFAEAHARLYQGVTDLHRRLGLSHARVQAGDAGSVRSEQERQSVRRAAAQFRELPEDLRQQMPALQNAIGQLLVAAGDYEAAIESFQSAASAACDPAARGEAHMNAFRVALEQPDYAAAMKNYLEAVKTDGKRFATFPVGKFVPIRVIGSGGFGVAFLCKHKYLNANVVVKSLATDHLEREVDDVFEEAQALAAINHPAIIKVQDCGYVDSAKKQRPFLVMDHFDGVTLEEYVKLKGPLSSEEFLALAEPVVAGLQAAHAKNILHRDIKPANLLVKRLKDLNGKPRWDVKLIDFGLALKQAERRSASHASKTGGSAGTTEYAAPEQLGKLEGVPVGPQTDVFGFGKTACFALFNTTSPLLKHWKSIPQPLAELLERCLNEKPEDRPRDFTVIARCFARLEQSGGAEIPTVNTIEPASGTAIRTGQGADYIVANGDAGEEIYAAAPSGGGGRKVLLILLMLFGTMGLLCCGGGGFGVWYGYSEITDWWNGITGQKVEDDNSQANNDPVKPGGNPFGGGNGGFNPPVHNGPTGPKTVTSTLTVSNVPSQLVADFVTSRIRKEAEHKDVFRAKATIKSGPTFAGDSVTVRIEAEEGKTAEFLRNIDLGAVESAGDDFTIKLLTPPKPSRKAVERSEEGLELSVAELRQILLALSKPNWSPGEYGKLASSKPVPQFRNAIRQLLRAHAAKHDDAIDALGVWGTSEDVEFILGSGRDVGHIIKAIDSLRAPAGIAYLVRNLGNFFHRDVAANALRKFGPIIEKDVLVALSDKEPVARMRACDLLKEFGSTAAIPALKVAAQDREERVAKAALEAWKTIAFHPAEPVTSESTKPVASKPSPPKTIDGATITNLDNRASSYQPNIALAPDGKGFYVLTPEDVRRYDWDGNIKATGKASAMTLLAVGTEGVLAANSLDAKLLDANSLEQKNGGPLNNPRWVSVAQNVLVVRSDALGFMMTVDMASFAAKFNYLDVRVKNTPRTVIILPAGAGKSNPILTPDARFMFTRGGGKLYRWKMEDFKLDRSPEAGPTIAGGDNGQIVVSPDGRYVAWMHPSGNTPDASFAIKPAAGAATFVFDVNDIKKPVAALVHGPRPVSLAFDNRGQAFVGTSGSRLLLFAAPQPGKELKPTKEIHLDEYGKIRQIVAHPDGDKLIVLTEKDMLRIDVPK